MANVRLIARLDIKGQNLIKSINLEGIRVIGNPHEHATRYYAQGADELIFMDVVASLYGRNNLHDIIRKSSEDVFIPITAGGGIRCIADAEQLLYSGADKIAINTAAIQNPGLITDIAKRFGSQCMVLSIEAKKIAENKWESYTDCGKQNTGLDVIEWAKRGQDLGAGEILLTSIDQEGTRKGYDEPLIKTVCNVVSIPVIASGGFGEIVHAVNAIRDGNAMAVSFADSLHYNRTTITEIRKQIQKYDIPVRKFA